MKFCPKCGNPTDDHATFCNQCGAPLNDQPNTDGTAPVSYTHLTLPTNSRV